MKTRKMMIAVLITAVIVLAGIFVGPKVARRVAQVAPSGMSLQQLTLGTYPDIDTSNLNDTQRKIVDVTKAEHAAQPEYTKYSQGAKEAWCADFVSWVMRESGAPLSNPNSGSWRIPGTLTLRDYYQSQNRFKPILSGYQPKLGDVVIYDGAGWFGQHTNIVLVNKDGKLTTVGGNENGKVRVQTQPIGIKGAIGYGVLTTEPESTT